jgi:hypothetical protein
MNRRNARRPKLKVGFSESCSRESVFAEKPLTVC